MNLTNNTPANDNATAHTSPCNCPDCMECLTGCGNPAAGVDGYCTGCMAEANAHYDERRGGWDGDRF